MRSAWRFWLRRPACTGPKQRKLCGAWSPRPEHRCSPYVRSDYPYPQAVEARIVYCMGDRV